MNSMMRKAMYFGIGAIGLTREKVEKFFNEMVEKGEMSKEEARQFIDEAIKKGQEDEGQLRNMIKEELRSMKQELSTVTKADLVALENRLTELEKKLQQG